MPKRMRRIYIVERFDGGGWNITLDELGGRVLGTGYKTEEQARKSAKECYSDRKLVAVIRR